MGYKRLTDRSIRSLKPRSKRYEAWDTSQGLGVRVTPSGAKTFVYIYRYQGRSRRMTLGRYPRVSLSEARQLHSAAQRKLVEDKVDPGEAKVCNARRDRAAPTMIDFAAEYIERWATPNKKSWREDERKLNSDVLPYIGKRKARDIRRRDIIKLLDRVVERGSPIAANRLLGLLKKMFRFGVNRDIVEFNICDGIERPARESSRDRVLDDAEIKIFIEKLNEPGSLKMSATSRAILKFILYTACRKGEAVGAEWSEFDFDKKIWTIPAERSKNGLDHRVPLIKQACALLKMQENDSNWVFPGHKPGTRTREHSVSKSVLESQSQFGFDKPFTPHDLRRTVASNLASLGVPRLHISKVLNHVERSATAIYDRHGYDQEKREALNKWSRKVDQIVAGKKSQKIVGLQTWPTIADG